MPAHLYYFDFSGLGEPCRFMLAYGNENFIDDRMTKEQFTEKKSSFPFGKVPCLEIDGLMLHQSMAICRYLARKYGIFGKTEKDIVAADVVAETVNDIRSALGSYHWASDPDTKQRMKEPALKQANEYLDRLEIIVSKNGDYLVKGQLTWADVLFASLAEYMSYMAGSDLYASRPYLKALKNKMYEQPGIKSFLSSRRPMPF